jgi:hypothetical protein
MRPNRTIILVPLLVVAMHANAEPTTRYFDLVNATYDSVTSLAIAPAGSDAFRDIEFDAPLHGGVTSTTVEIPDGDCLRDIRVAFKDGRALLYAGINVCRYGRLRLTPRDGRQG